MTIAIVTDSTSSLSPADAEREGIAIVPLQVIIGAETYTEGVDVTADMIAEALAAFVPVSTSRPTPDDFLAVYERLAAEGAEAIVSVHLSAKMSGTLDSAVLASKQAPVPVTCIDSTQVGIATGFAAGRAANARDAGEDAVGVAEAARRAGESSTVPALRRHARIPQAGRTRRCRRRPDRISARGQADPHDHRRAGRAARARTHAGQGARKAGGAGRREGAGLRQGLRHRRPAPLEPDRGVHCRRTPRGGSRARRRSESTRSAPRSVPTSAPA